MNEGWIKLHRSTLENPIVMKDSDHIAIWVYLLMNATHKEYDSYFSGNRITLKPGQLITVRRKIASDLRCSESKVQRVLTCFKNEHQIEKQVSNQNRLLTIVNWNKYQQGEHQGEHQLNNDRTTSEQRVNTNKNDKNGNNGNNGKKVGEQGQIFDDKQKELSKWLKDNYPNVYRLEQHTPQQMKLLKSNYGENLIHDYLEKMDNWKPLTRKNKKVYLTLKKWLEKDRGAMTKDQNGKLLNKQKPRVEDMRGQNM